MTSKRELEEYIYTLENKLKATQEERVFFEEECLQLVKSLTILGRACHSIYKYYPFVLSECCVDTRILKLFKMEEEFQSFLSKLMKDDKQKGGNDEI